MSYEQLLKAVQIYENMDNHDAVEELLASDDDAILHGARVIYASQGNMMPMMALKLAIIARELKIPLPEPVKSSDPLPTIPGDDELDETRRVVFDPDPMAAPAPAEAAEGLPLLEDDDLSEADTTPMPTPLKQTQPDSRIANIISMERGLTNGKTGRHPKWTCKTNELEKAIWIFDHPLDAEKNTAKIFFDAGYQEILQSMQVDDWLYWKPVPIQVEVVKDSSGYYRVVQVAPKTEFIRATTIPVTDGEKEQARCDAIIEAQAALKKNNLVVWDTETTGTGMTDEIVEIGIVDIQSGEVFESLILPDDPMRLNIPQTNGQVPSAIHGITPEMLTAAPRFSDIYSGIFERLYGKHWVIFNADFDTRLLKQDCERHEENYLIPESATCVMLLYARFRGKWNPERNGYAWPTLDEACEEMGLKVEAPAHRATGDAKRALQLLTAIATTELPKSAIPF